MANFLRSLYALPTAKTAVTKVITNSAQARASTRATTPVLEVAEVPYVITVRPEILKFDDHGLVRLVDLANPDDCPLYLLALKTLVTGEETLAVLVFQTVGKGERVDSGFQVEGGVCDGLDLFRGVPVIGGDVDVGAIVEACLDRVHGRDTIPYSFDVFSEVIILFKAEDRRNEFDRNWGVDVR